MPQLERSPHVAMKTPRHKERSRMPQLRPDAAKKNKENLKIKLNLKKK